MVWKVARFFIWVSSFGFDEKYGLKSRQFCVGTCALATTNEILRLTHNGRRLVARYRAFGQGRLPDYDLPFIPCDIVRLFARATKGADALAVLCAIYNSAGTSCGNRLGFSLSLCATALEARGLLIARRRLQLRRAHRLHRRSCAYSLDRCKVG